MEVRLLSGLPEKLLTEKLFTMILQQVNLLINPKVKTLFPKLMN